MQPSVLIVEEGQPAYIEEAIQAVLRRHEVNATRIFGKQAGKQDSVVFPLAGEYTGETVLNGVARFIEAAAPRVRQEPRVHAPHVPRVPARQPPQPVARGVVVPANDALGLSHGGAPGRPVAVGEGGQRLDDGRVRGLEADCVEGRALHARPDEGVAHSATRARRKCVGGRRARGAGLLVNVVDKPALCDFTTPSIIDRAPVIVAVGTGGASAGLAKALRLRLERLLPQGLGALAEALYAARGDLQFTVRQMDAVGDGLWRKAFELTRARLERDGLLDPSRLPNGFYTLRLTARDIGGRTSTTVATFVEVDTDTKAGPSPPGVGSVARAWAVPCPSASSSERRSRGRRRISSLSRPSSPRSVRRSNRRRPCRPNSREAPTRCSGCTKAGIPRCPSVAPETIARPMTPSIASVKRVSVCCQPSERISSQASQTFENNTTAEKLRCT